MIVCDIMMPELNGYGVLEALRKEPSTATIPFIFLTAKTDRIDMRQGMVLGADDYLTKPFLVRELLDSIQSRLHKRAEFQRQAELKLEELRENITTALPHELRTPLNTIIGFSEMLVLEGQHLKPDQIVDWAQHINLAGMRLFNLIENYLLFTRIESIASNPNKIAQLREARLSNAGAEIEFQAMNYAQKESRVDDLVLEVKDAGMLCISDKDFAKIIVLLLDNAFKFSHAGSVVTIQATPVEQFYEVRVIDKGRGMTAEQINAIGAYMQFERDFYEQQGAGLGLAIVKRLVELYAGRIEIVSEVEVGTTVKFTIPLAGQ